MSYFERLRTTNKPKVETICLVDEGEIEVIASYITRGGIILESFEVVIDGVGIDLLSTLKTNQYNAICEQIQNSFR
jgi:hypothetical protein